MIKNLNFTLCLYFRNNLVVVILYKCYKKNNNYKKLKTHLSKWVKMNLVGRFYLSLVYNPCHMQSPVTYLNCNTSVIKGSAAAASSMTFLLLYESDYDLSIYSFFIFLTVLLQCIFFYRFVSFSLEKKISKGNKINIGSSVRKKVDILVNLLFLYSLF